MSSKSRRNNKNKSRIWLCSLAAVIFISISLLIVSLNSKNNTVHNNGSFTPYQPEFISSRYYPPTLKTLIVNLHSKENHFDFILDTGNGELVNAQELKPIAKDLIKYFFLGLTLPSEEFWVNLNPIEPENTTSLYLSQTDVGKILLEVDLKLKQDAARYTDPQYKLGRDYWQRLKERLKETNLPTNQIPTGTRLWIIPGKIIIEEDEHSFSIVTAKLKVCLESEYLQNDSQFTIPDSPTAKIQQINAQVFKEVVLPTIEHQVNYGQAYAQLRQVYHSLILACGYKKKFWEKDTIYSSCINQAYLDDLYSQSPWSKEKFFQAYLASFNNGEYSFYSREYDSTQLDMVNRHYFYGGVRLAIELSEAIDGRGAGSSIAEEVKDGLLRVEGLNIFNPGGKKIRYQTFTNSASPLRVAKLGIRKALPYSELADLPINEEIDPTIDIEASSYIKKEGGIHLGIESGLSAGSPIARRPLDNSIVGQRLKAWVNSNLNLPLDTPLNWKSIEELNRQFESSPEKQNEQVTALSEILDDLMLNHKSRAFIDELSQNKRLDRKIYDTPVIVAIAVPNTVVFAVKLKESDDELVVVDYDLMGAGKVIGASETLVALGSQVDLVSLVGQGKIAKRFENDIKQIGYKTFVPVKTQADIRFAPNIIRERDNFEWHFSAPGFLLQQSELNELQDTVAKVLSGAMPGTIVLMGGKTPPGTDFTFWKELIREAKSRNLKVYFDNLPVDLSINELKSLLSAGVYLIKPNLDEFANVVGKDKEYFQSNHEEIIKESRMLMESVNANGGDLQIVVVSMAERGAILVTAEETFYAMVPETKIDNTLGAGDSLIGALAYKLSMNRPLDEAIQFAVAVSTISSQKTGVMRTASLEEAEEFSAKVKVTSSPINRREGKSSKGDVATLNIRELPEDLFDFERRAIDIALRFFDPLTDIHSLRQNLLNSKGIQAVHWNREELTIVGNTEVVKLHLRQNEINERHGLKDRFYLKTLDQRDIVTVKIYHKDARDSKKDKTPIYVLGVVRNSHDSGAVLIKDGLILGAIEEERLNMNKHTRAYFPRESTRYLLKTHGISWKDISHIAVSYDYNFFRDTPHSQSPYKHFLRKYGLPGLASEAAGRYDTDTLQLFLEEMAIDNGTGYIPAVTFVKHHKAHAAAAWHSSNFPEPTLAVVIDGRGEDEATTIWLANDGRLHKISSTPYMHSLGHFYHIVTKYLGYRSHDEGKVMGYAPYGAPRNIQEEVIVNQLRNLMVELIWFNPKTGQVELNQELFNFSSISDFADINFSNIFLKRLAILVPPMSKDETGHNLTPENRPYAHLAFAMQERVEQVIAELVNHYLNDHLQTKCAEHVVMAGGLALNIVANGKLIESGIVDADKLFVPAYPADDGTAVGAALSVADEEYDLNVQNVSRRVSFGKTYSNIEIKSALDRFGLVEGNDYIRVANDQELVNVVVGSLLQDETVAWFQGGAELGPRALGNRSILSRLDDPKGNYKINRIKNREFWRPSALSIQEERTEEFLEGVSTVPFMTIAFPVTKDKASVIKAGAHPADGTTRPQTVSRESNPLYWDLLNEVGKRTGIPGVLNTSFNRWGPIVETPEDALNTFFYADGLDILAIGNFIIKGRDRLKPSILNGRDEKLLREVFNQARYGNEPMSQSWTNFWEVASDLADSRNARQQHYLIAYAVNEGRVREILKVPLVKEMFQSGPREVMIADLAGRIQQKLDVNFRTTIAIETTAKEYSDIIFDLFRQFAPTEISAKWNIVKMGYSQEIPMKTTIQQQRLDPAQAIERLSMSIQNWQKQQRKTPVLVALTGPAASGRATIATRLSLTHYVIDEQRWGIETEERDVSLPYPFSNIRLNDYLNTLKKLQRGQTVMLPLNRSLSSDMPLLGFVPASQKIIDKYRPMLLKENSQLWIRNDGELFEQITPEPGDVFIINTSGIIDYPALQRLFEEVYIVVSAEELRELSMLKKEAEASGVSIPPSICGWELATALVETEQRDLRAEFEYPNPLITLTDTKVFQFVCEILIDRFSRNGLDPNVVIDILKYALVNRIDPEYAISEIYRNVIDFSNKGLNTPFHRYYYDIYKKSVKPRLMGALIKGKVKGPVVVDAGAGMTALALDILKEHPEITRFISTHNVDYSRMAIDDHRMEFTLEEEKDGFHFKLEDDIANTVIITGRMHHLHSGKEEEFLQEVIRILHPEGRILIIEDTWPEQLSGAQRGKFIKRFHNLNAQQKQSVLAFLDWVGTRLIPGEVSMPRPWNFKPVEEWSYLFKKVGLGIASVVYHGFEDEKFTPLPLCTIELTNKSVSSPVNFPVSASSSFQDKRIDTDFGGIDLRTMQFDSSAK